MHRRAGGVGGDVDRRLRRIGGDDPAAATAVHQDAPGDQVLVGRERKPFVRQPHHPARAHEVAQLTPHLPGLRLAKLEFFGDVVRPDRDVMFAPQQAQKSIYKIHQVMVRLTAGLSSGTLVSRGRSAHNANIPKTADKPHRHAGELETKTGNHSAQCKP